MPYRAPLDDLRFLMTHVAGAPAVALTDRFAEATPETIEAVLTGAARLAEEVWAPLNRAGDRHPARLDNGVVRTSPGFADGWRAAADLGVMAITAGAPQGGLGLPVTLATAVNEMLAGSCLALHNATLISQGQIEALERHGSPALQALYLPRLIAGDWTATMNLTEPQAGSDVGALAARARPAEDDRFRITGQKIYITWADHDMAANVVHLVLARLPDSPPGTRGISLFLVPKLIPDAAGRPGAANALRVVSLEHKLGLHGSPTAVMSYEGATAWLVGEAGGGMAAMFTMMNNARLGVAAQGVGLAEAAYQAARSHAAERRQFGQTIDSFPDVARMLADMRAEILAARAIALTCAAAIDMASATGAAGWTARAALLTPIAKAFGSEIGSKVADLAVQVHGGMGFVEDTGVAQFLRDVRITRIYEGTNGIQAMDLVGRKLADGGEAALALIEEVCLAAEAARGALPELAEPVWQAAFDLREATEALCNMSDRGAGAQAYLMAFARLLGAAAHLAAARAGGASRRALARHYIARLLPELGAHLAVLRAGPGLPVPAALDD